MKHLFLSLTAFASLTMASTSAFADLHDTYAQSCTKYGGRGKIDKVNHCIYWHQDHEEIVEWFVKNECVSMKLIPDKGCHYSIAQVEALLPYESGSTQSWQSIGSEGNRIAQWGTSDGLILAALYDYGHIQFSYAWYLNSKGLLAPP